MRGRGVGTFRVVLASNGRPDEVADLLNVGPLAHLMPKTAPSGMGTAITVTTTAETQAQAEEYVRRAVGRALGASVRVVMTVTL
jgi:hypothetical protein